ncbi:MAG TPA: carboxypeptidase-like regulatory domain-containing protein [Candidatus Elarobacter sp.]|nr:carboxypeptidase-like regulatory domain-containing protein [Candidatus Elarobacter sp.]
MLALLASTVPDAARADELLVGALRDQDGAVVPGAAVTALDAAGAVLARDRSAADGTFALATATRPAVLQILAPDADPLRVAVPPAPGTPVTAIVHHHRSVDFVPAAADVAALPAGSLDAVASVIPYRVAFPSAVSDRWLSRGRGVTTLEDLPFYRRGDGGDATALLPSHGFGAVDVHDALQAPWYGDRAGGGTIDADLFDRADTLRATTRDASAAALGNPQALAAESWDPDGVRRLFAVRATSTFGPLVASGVAIAGIAPSTNYAGAGADLHADTRALALSAHVALTQDDASTNAVRDDGSVAELSLDASGRGPNALLVRARWRDERGTLGDEDSSHHDAALVVGGTRGNVLRATAAVALAYGDEHSYDDGTTASALAVLPSLSLDAPLAAAWSVHAGARSATLGTPGYAIARSSLGEVGFAFADHRRVRAEIEAFAEGDTAPTAVNRGFAVALGWEVAPRVSLRAWSLRDADLLDASASPYPGGPAQSVRVTRAFDRDVVWLTWDAPVRLDVLVRYGALEGNVRVPLGARYALTLGSYVRSGAHRFELGLAGR